MRKFFVLLTVYLMIAMGAHASVSNQFAVSAEWLYFQIGKDEPFFATEFVDGSTMGRQRANKATWHSGGRVEAIYHFCDGLSALRLRSAFFPHFSHSRTVSGNLVFEPTGGIDSRIKSDHRFHFWNAEFLFEQSIICSYPFFISIQAGTHLLYLKSKLTYDLFAEQVINKFSSKSVGAGPEIGVELQYTLCHPLSIHARAVGALIVARKRAHWREIEFSGISVFSVKDDSYWKLIPATDFRLGLNYCSLYNCMVFNFEAGYEALFYKHPISQFSIFDEVNFNSNFFGHGPYVRAEIAF